MSCFGVNLEWSSIFHCLWDLIGGRMGYIVKLEENMDSLHNALAELQGVRNDLQRRVQTAEERMLLKRTKQVGWWLRSVEGVETEVVEMEGTFERMIVECFGRNFRPNLYSRYNLSKRVMKVRTDVDVLIGKRKENSFHVVAVQPLPAAVEKMPRPPVAEHSIGMDLLLQKILRWLREDDNVGVIGIYGMGGVGKTAILKKINNEFLVTLGGFCAVIWVVVSQGASIEKIQIEIGKKLGLSFAENASDEDRYRNISWVLSQKRFILLLDDIWERVDLEAKVGIPRPNSQNKSKVVFTTRKEDVCGQMDADKKLKVEILGPQEAWDLFRENAGEEAISCHPETPALAKSVAEECCGLPLALITIGRAMARKKTPQEWKHAISVLKKSKAASEIAGMEDEVFFRLKFSYDTLDDTLKSCFLYCSLFPEDYDIDKEELIDYWIVEGIINEWHDYEEARNKGYDVIGRLKAACLLESGHGEEKEVKMHPVMRDLALSIASDKFLVQTGAAFREVSEVQRWMKAERVSLIGDNIQEITATPICPNVLTLILRGNGSLRNVNDSLFQCMHHLRVLDLSGTSICKLSLGICGLVQLQYLNLSRTSLIDLPEEMGNLVKLTFLDLSSMSLGFLLHIPRGVISRLSMLKVLKLHRITIDRDGFNITELKELQDLAYLEIDIYNNYDFQIFLESQKLLKVTRQLRILNIAQPASVQLSSIFGEVMVSLKGFEIRDCNWKELMIGSDTKTEGNCSISIMESLTLFRLFDLNIIQLGWSSLQSLRKLYIGRCHMLKNLTWVLQLHNIRDISVECCHSLKEVIDSSDVEVEAEGLKWLTKLSLDRLPALTSISNQARPFPSLIDLFVDDCDKLKKLNINTNTDPRLKIRGQQRWWDDLEWEEESIRTYFLPLFQVLDE